MQSFVDDPVDEIAVEGASFSKPAVTGRSVGVELHRETVGGIDAALAIFVRGCRGDLYTWPLTAKEVAGVPRCRRPPHTRDRVPRAALGRAHDRMGLPMQVLLERLTGVLGRAALFVFVELGVADHSTRRAYPAELAARVGADADALGRLLAFLASRGCQARPARPYPANP